MNVFLPACMIKKSLNNEDKDLSKKGFFKKVQAYAGLKSGPHNSNTCSFSK